jgi:hypothetical protein
MMLWRPVGLLEMAWVFDSGMRALPPRRAEQPIFYPVLNRAMPNKSRVSGMREKRRSLVT